MNDDLKRSLKNEIESISSNAKGFTLYGLRKNSQNNTYVCNCTVEFTGEFLLSARGLDETLVSITYIDGRCVIEGINSERDFFDNAIIKQDETIFTKAQLEVIESKDFEIKDIVKEPSIIVGPPGTGKTAVITKIVKEAIKNKEKVLVVSPTNMAVENVFEKLYGDFDEMGLSDEDIILQIKTEDEALMKYSPKSIADEKTIMIQDELDVLNVALDDIVKEIRDIEPLLSIELDKLDVNKTTIKNLEKDKAKKSHDKVTIEKEIKSLTNRIETLEGNILVKAVASAFKGTKVDEIKNEKEQLEKKLNTLNDEISEIENKIAEVQNKELTEKIGEFRNKLQELRDTKKKITERIKILNEEKEDLINLDFYSSAKLVGTTLVGAALNKKIQKGNFDKIIVDEASMASLPSLYLACSSIKEWDNNRKDITVSDFGHFYDAQQDAIKLSVNSQFVFVGDPKQLSTIAKTKELKKTIFDIYNVKEIFNGKKMKNVAFLDINFRCHPEITELCSELFYGGLLKSGREHTGKSALYIKNNQSFMTSKSKSFVNEGNRISVIEQTSLALRRGKRSIGTITPFKAQAEDINQSLLVYKDEYPDADIQAGTVHKFQGKEKNIVIFDITYSSQGNKQVPITFLGDMESEAARLLNVAMTRAEDFFVLVGDVNGIVNQLSRRADKEDLVFYKWLIKIQELAYKKQVA